MKLGVQIIKENWMESMVRRAEESLSTLTIRKPVVKHIPIEVWTDIGGQGLISLSKWFPCEVRNSGGKTYLVTTISHISIGLENK